MSETYYRPGLLFKSQMAAHQEVCRSKSQQLTTTGEVLSENRELLAEFAYYAGPEYSYTGFDGSVDKAADIYGHYFDLDSQAEAKGWDDEEKETVARHLIRMTTRFPGRDFTLYSKPASPKPWPKYDDTPFGKISEMADALGLVEASLVYEQENKNRKSVVTELERIVNAVAESADLEEALTAA